MRRKLLLTLGCLLLAGCSPGGCGSSTAQPAAGSTPSAAAPTYGPPVPDSTCSAEASSHSLNSNTATSFTIVNHTSETLGLYWLNFQGQRVHYTDVSSGQSKDQGTFITHPWVVTDPNGTCIHLFLVTTPATITIG